MVKVDESKRADLNTCESNLIKDIDKLTGCFDSITECLPSCEWKGQAYERYNSAYNYLNTYTTAVLESYNELKGAIDDLILNTDDFVTNSPSVQLLKG